MRTRTSLTAVLSAIIALLVATIAALTACAGPDVSADGVGPVPETADPAPAPGPDPGGAARPGGSGAGAGHKGTRPKQYDPTKKPPPEVAVPTPTKSSPAPQPVPPKLGKASVPRGSTYSVSGDGQAFTMVYSTLTVETGSAESSRTLTTTVPVSGDTRDAVVEFAASGYAFADQSAKAKLTMTACGRKLGRTFRSGTDDEYVQNLSVPLRGAKQCSITLTVEVLPGQDVPDSTAVIDVLALDAQFI
jgi:hypothetical protein